MALAITLITGKLLWLNYVVIILNSAVPTTNNLLKMYSQCLTKSVLRFILKIAKSFIASHLKKKDNIAHLYCFIIQPVHVIMNMIFKCLCHRMRVLFGFLVGCVIFSTYLCLNRGHGVLVLINTSFVNYATESTYFTTGHISYSRVKYAAHNMNPNADRNYKCHHRVTWF